MSPAGTTLTRSRRAIAAVAMDPPVRRPSACPGIRWKALSATQAGVEFITRTARKAELELSDASDARAAQPRQRHGDTAPDQDHRRR